MKPVRRAPFCSVQRGWSRGHVDGGALPSENVADYGRYVDLHLTGQRALVTGASKGIGLGVARTLAAEGVDLLLAARTQARLEDEAAAIRDEFGVAVEVLGCDLSVSADQQRLAAVATASRLDIVVNNAGAIPGGSLTDIDEEVWRDAWDLKVFGYINLTRLLLPVLQQAGRGVILNVIGAAADRPSAGYIAGAAGNSALVGFTKAIGATSGRHGVRALAVNPGLIVTDRMTDLLRQQADEKFGDADQWEQLMPSDPAPGTVAQVADVVTFLVSDRASHVTGVALTIDGGAVAR